MKALFERKIVHVLMQIVMMTGEGTDPLPPLFSQQRVREAILRTSGHEDEKRAEQTIRQRVGLEPESIPSLGTLPECGCSLFHTYSILTIDAVFLAVILLFFCPHYLSSHSFIVVLLLLLLLLQSDGV
jgi:hypothetical protein